MLKRRWRLIVGSLLVLWAVVASLNTFVIQVYSTPSTSMMPTLRIGDVHVVDRWHGSQNLHRGDVVAFHQPPGWHEPPYPRSTPSRIWHAILNAAHVTEPDNAFVKRVIGLPGDHVECRTPRGYIFVNGVVQHEKYTMDDTGCAQPYDITVPKGSVWVLGDNRLHSADSSWWDRDHDGTLGSVPLSTIRGRMAYRIYPW